MCNDQLQFFFLFRFSFSSSKKLNSWPSPGSGKSQIFSLSWALVLDLHRLHGCLEEHCPCSSSNVVAKKNVLVRAKNFSARNPQLFSFSSLLTEVPKNRGHSRLIQEYFSCLFFFFRWRASILLNCSSMDVFHLLHIEQKSLRRFRLPDGMKRCRRVGNSGEKVWLW